MSRSGYKHKRPWLAFLVFTLVFFVGFHNVYSSKADFDVSHVQAGDPSEGKPTRYAAYLVFVVFSLLSLTAKRQNTIAVSGALGLFALAFLSYSSVSILWAEDRELTTMKVLLLLILSLGALAAVRRFSAEDILWFVLFVTVSNLLLGFGAEVALGVFRPFEEGYRFFGTLGPNRSGLNFALLLLTTLAATRIATRARSLLFVLAFAAILFLVITGSRTAFVSALAAFIAYRLLVTPLRAQLLSLLALVICLCALLLLSLERPVLRSAEDALLLGRPAADTATLTGRVSLWQDCLKFVAERPILGYGYNSFFTPDRAADFKAREKWNVGGAHSAYLEILLDLGVLGLAIYVGVLLLSVLRSIRYFRGSKQPVYAFIAAMLLVFILDGMLESVAITYPTSLSFLAMVTLGHLGFVRPKLGGSGTPEQSEAPRERAVAMRGGGEHNLRASNGV